MRKLLYIAIAATAACTSPDPAQLAANTAERYYAYLLEGNYPAFVDAHYRPDSLPQSYRQQLIDNAKMYIAQQKAERRGIKAVSIVGAKADTARHTANVFLMLAYGDSTSEEIVVPMTQHQGIWYLR